MRNNSKDETLKRNYIQKYQYLIGEYEKVKLKQHDIYKTAKDFYASRGVCPQTFLKYYARYKQNPVAENLLPQKRGPRFHSRRTPALIENKTLEIRKKGLNKYEIHIFYKNIISDADAKQCCRIVLI